MNLRTDEMISEAQRLMLGRSKELTKAELARLRELYQEWMDKLRLIPDRLHNNHCRVYARVIREEVLDEPMEKKVGHHASVSV